MSCSPAEAMLAPSWSAPAPNAEERVTGAALTELKRQYSNRRRTRCQRADSTWHEVVVAMSTVRVAGRGPIHPGRPRCGIFKVETGTVSNRISSEPSRDRPVGQRPQGNTQDASGCLYSQTHRRGARQLSFSAGKQPRRLRDNEPSCRFGRAGFTGEGTRRSNRQEVR